VGNSGFETEGRSLSWYFRVFLSQCRFEKTKADPTCETHLCVTQSASAKLVSTGLVSMHAAIPAAPTNLRFKPLTNTARGCNLQDRESVRFYAPYRDFGYLAWNIYIKDNSF